MIDCWRFVAKLRTLREAVSHSSVNLRQQQDVSCSTETFNKPSITKATLSVYIKKLNNIQLTKSNLLHELKDVSEQISTAYVQLSLKSDRTGRKITS